MTPAEAENLLLEAGWFDSKDCSDVTIVYFTVDDQKPAGKGFIPMIDGWMLLLLIPLLGIVISLGRRHEAKD